MPFSPAQAGSGTARGDQHINGFRAGFQQHPGAGGTGGAGGQHVVDQQQASAGKAGRAVGADTANVCAVHHAGALLGRQVAERHGDAGAAERVRQDRLAGQARPIADKERGLVVAAGDQAAAVQRHGHQQIRIPQ